MRDESATRFNWHMYMRERALESFREHRTFCEGKFTHANITLSMEELDELINVLTETDAIQNAYKLGYEEGTKDTKKSIAKSFETFKKSMEG